MSNDSLTQIQNSIVSIKNDLKEDINEIKESQNNLMDTSTEVRVRVTELATDIKYLKGIKDEVDKNQEKITEMDRKIYAAYAAASVIATLIPIILTASGII